MFTKSAAFYDAIYASLGKDYAAEAQRLHELIQQHKRSPGHALLDVACGTGSHLALLQQWHDVEGLDLDPGMLEIARQRCPDVPLHQADMVDFDLRRRYDVVVCLFSSIGYVRTRPRLRQALHTMARHLHPGGVLVVEPWLTPEVYRAGGVHAHFVDRPHLKIARMNICAVEDGLSVLDFHYLVAMPAGIEHFTERHELGLFSHDEYLAAFVARRLEVVYDPQGLMGRGLYVGICPL